MQPRKNPIRYIGYYAFGWVSRAIATLLFKTCKVTVFGQKIENKYHHEHPGQGLLYASWHRGLMHLIYFYRFLNFIVMASASDDGELAAQATRRFGWIPIRGSSTRRGAQALREMVGYASRGHSGGLVVDAPQGPRCISKIGIIILAKRTGLPILPVMWSADRCWRLGSWDRTIIPKPFSRIVFIYAKEPIFVSKDASRATCEKHRKELDRILNTMMRQTDLFFKQSQKKDPRDIVVSNPCPE